MAIQLPPNSTGTIVDTNTVGGKDREIVNIGDPVAANTAVVSNSSSPGGAAQGLSTRNIPIKQQFASPVTASPLGISGVFTGAWQDSQADATVYVQASARADVASAASGFEIDETDDTTDANFTRIVASASVSPNTTTYLSANIRGRFWRVKYTNGGTAQTSFKLEATASSNPPLNVSSIGTLLVDGSAVTQPVSGTVTANQGGAPWTGRIQDGAGSTLATVTASNALKVDGSAVTQPVSGTIDVSDRAGRLVGQVEGRAASGAAKAGNPVQIGGVFNTTQPTVTTGQAVEAQATARGALIVATGVDAFATNATLSAETTKVIGTVRVLGNAGAIVDGATGSAVPANALYNGARAATTNPTAVSAGQLVGVMADILGKLVVRAEAPRERVVTNTITLSSTTETTLIAAGAAGVFRDLTMITLANTSATGVRVDIRDATAGTVRWSFWVPATQTVGAVLRVPWPQTTAANNWTAQLSAAVTDVRIAAQAIETA
jgi:hypothetical protein